MPAMLATSFERRHSTPVSDRPDAPGTGQPRTIAAEIAGTRLSLVESGPERLETMLRLIDEAQDSVRLLFYMFSGDGAGNAVRNALIRAAERGCDVKLLIDGFGSSGVKPDFFQPVHDAGAQVCLFHPRYGARYLLRNHQKIAIFDGRRAIVGGPNINDGYFGDGSDPEDWRDLSLTIDGAAVTPLTRYYDAVFKWTTTKSARIRTLRRLINRHSQRRGALQWKFSGPMRRRNPWPTQIAKEIIGGTRMDMIAAYFSPPYAMLRRIARMGRRGKVRVITAAKSDNATTIAAARHTYKRLLKNGVEMYEYQRCRLHTKLVIIDDVVHIGSSNFDFRSLYLNLEVMLRIEDAGFAAQMRSYFERELGDSLQITPEIHRQRATWWRKAKWTLGHFLVTTMDYTVTRRLNFGAEK